MKSIYILFFIFLITTQVFAQSSIKKADQHFRKSNYALAISSYNKYLERNKPTKEIAYNLAESYRMLSETEKAAEWYKKALELGYNEPDINLNFGLVLKSNGEYLDAIDQFISYGLKKPENKDQIKQITQSCYDALEWISYPQQTELLNKEILNSPYSEFSPVIYKGKTIFISDRPIPDKQYGTIDVSGYTGKPYLKVFTTDEKGKPTLFSEEITGLFHDGPVSFSPTGDTLILTKTFKVKNPSKIFDDKTKADAFINRLELWYSIKKANQWSPPVAFPYNNKIEYSTGHAVFSPDGKAVYFASDMPGGLGSTDLYYSQINKDGTWGKPVNLGPSVNSPYKELFPFITKDHTLYFSSASPEGMGGLDLYTSVGNKNTWSVKQNLRFPMNSPKDDFGIYIDTSGTSGYFSSNRNGGYGSDDIYLFRKPGCILSGITMERLPEGKDQVLENVVVELFRKGDTTEIVGYARSSAESRKKICVRTYVPCQIMNDAKGKFLFQLQNNVSYELKASKEGYFTQRIDVPDDCKKPGDTINLIVQLTKIELNKPIVIEDLLFDDANKLYVKKNIYFDLDKANIRYDAALTLDKLVRLLEDNEDMIVELGAHTDSRHSEEYNLDLSQKRAEAVVKYIVSKGIEPGRIKAKGYGETMLLNGCKDGVACTEQQHEVNRRVELKVLQVTPKTSHLVTPNETLFSIAKKHQITVEDLKVKNNLNNDNVYSGDVLIVK